MQQDALPLQMLIFRICLQPFFDSTADPLPHLAGCCACKCHDKQPVNIDRIIRICNQGKNPLHKHSCLTGSGSCRYQHIAVTCLNDLLLFVCPCYSHLFIPL